MNKYWFKIKGSILTISVILLSNAYLIFLLTKYVVDTTISSIFILLTNEIFLFVGILFYFYYELKVKLDIQLEEQRHITKRLNKEIKQFRVLKTNGSYNNK